MERLWTVLFGRYNGNGFRGLLVMVSRNGEVDIDAIIQDDRILEAAGQEAVRDALLDHKRRGDPIVVWKDGKVVWVPAEQIRVDGAQFPGE